MVNAPMDLSRRTFFSHWKPDDLGPKSFGNPPDCNLVEHTNSRQFRAAEIPAANGHANARALARVYAALANGGTIDGVELLTPDMVDESGRVHVDGQDVVMDLPTRFGLGFEITVPEGEFSFGPGRAHLRSQRLRRLARRPRSRRGDLVRLRDEPDGVERATRRRPLVPDLRRALRLPLVRETES